MNAGLCLLGALALCAELPDEPADLLTRARARLLEAACKAPRYTCMETIQRSYFRRLRPATGCDQIAKLRSPLTTRWGGPPRGYIQSRTKFPRVGTYVFRSRQPRYLVPRGFESEWVTLAALPR